jgi:hypothetical protein
MQSPVNTTTNRVGAPTPGSAIDMSRLEKARQTILANLQGPKGLEKIILLAQINMRKFQRGMDQILYGKDEAISEKNKKTIKTNPLDIGVVNILDTILQVDFCDLINYTLLNTKITKVPFDPKVPLPENANFQERQVYKLKKLAYEIQTIIDGGESYLANNDLTKKNDIPKKNEDGTIIEEPDETTSENEEEAKKKNVFKKIVNIRAKFQELKSTIAPEMNQIERETGVNLSINSNDIINLFPQLKTILPSIEDKIQYLNKWTDYRQIPISEYQKIVNTIDKIKVIVIGIQGFTTPSDLFTFLPKNISKEVANKITEITKIINPARAIPFIKNLIQTLTKINLVLKKILSIISFLNTIITVALLFIKVVKKILIFFKVNPTPAMFTALGIISTTEDGKQKLKEVSTKFEDRLSQIAYLFQIIFQICTTISLEITSIIAKLRVLLISLQECSNVDDKVVNELREQIEELETNLKGINRFIDTKNNSNTNSPNKRIGEYTIQIVTQDIVDEAFSLNRRYGIALDSRKNIVVSSVPTFASLDSIIIAEVKQLLSAKGLIKFTSSDYSIKEEEIINDVKSYLYDDDIPMDINYNVSTQLDAPDNENDNEGIGLNAFINKLNGGKALRKRVRAARIKNNNDLITSLKQDDPDGKYTSANIASLEKENKDLEKERKLEELQKEKKKYIAISIASPNPVGKILALRKIREIDEEIKKIKNS